MNFVPHVSQNSLQFIVRYWRDVSISKVYILPNFASELANLLHKTRLKVRTVKNVNTNIRNELRNMFSKSDLKSNQIVCT